MANPSGPRVLVVDDEPDICRNLSDILTDVGCRVDYACDGLAALDLVREAAYDVALLDLRMPGMDGLTLYREIKKLRASTVAIVVTAYASESISRAALEAGAWQLLPKPVDVERMLDLVAEACEQPLVLIVDDDRDLCENLWQILRGAGYRVGLAHEAGAVAVQLEGSGVRIALIDMRLPGGDGTQVCREVREAAPGAKIVLTTGHSEMGPVIEEAVGRGADASLHKPLDVPQLLSTFNRLSTAAGVRGWNRSTTSTSW